MLNKQIVFILWKRTLSNVSETKLSVCFINCIGKSIGYEDKTDLVNIEFWCSVCRGRVKGASSGSMQNAVH